LIDSRPTLAHSPSSKAAMAVLGTQSSLLMLRSTLPSMKARMSSTAWA
jgi:hypothetical protein